MGLSRAEVIDLLKESLSMTIKKEPDTRGDIDITVEIKIKDEVIVSATTKSEIENELL